MSILKTTSITYSNSLLINTVKSSVHNLNQVPKLLTTLPQPISQAVILRRTNILVYSSNKKTTFYIYDLSSEKLVLQVDLPKDINEILGFYWLGDQLMCRCRLQDREKFIVYELKQNGVQEVHSMDSKADSDSIALNVVGISERGSLAVRSLTTGHVDYYTDIKKKEHKTFKCHDGDIRAIALNSEGTLMATCSNKGTLIRIWNLTSDNTTPLLELRRGMTQTQIHSLAFSNDSRFLVVTSSSPTIHIYNIPKEGEASKNSSSFFSNLQKDFATYKFENQTTRPPSIAVFDQDRNQYIWYVSEDGLVLQLELDQEKGGDLLKVFDRQLYESK